MKRFVVLFVVVATAFSAVAQEKYIVRTGVVKCDGKVEFVEPKSTIAVDVTVECYETVVGPYARYAQKYLGVRAPLSNKISYYIKGATIALTAQEAPFASESVAEPTSALTSQFGTERDFARLLPDRMDARALTADQAAAEAAAAIFSLRKHRIELITGEAGENVFGGGLEAALRTIDDYEAKYLELFFGKQITSSETVRFIVKPSADKFGYLLGRFSEKEGMVPSTDLSGEILMLQIDPSGDTSLQYIAEAGIKDKVTIDCRVADFSSCILSCGTERIASAVLPLFEFGRTIKVAR